MVQNAPRRRQHGQAAVEQTAAKLQQLVIEYVGIGEIHPNDYNPNRQTARDFELLKASIRDDGFTQPVICANDYTIIDGEHRWRAAYELGIQRIPVVVLPMDPAQARVATLRHNRARGSEDLELATAVLRDLETLGSLAWAADALQISDEALEKLFADLPAPEALAGEDFNPGWEPDKGTPKFEPTTFTDAHGEAQVDTTPDAQKHVQKADQDLQTAKPGDEQMQVLSERNRNIFRFTLSFVEEEAELVKRILGASPALEVLRLCREELERRAA